MLSPQLLEMLRDYWKATRPTQWLFPGDIPGRPITQACRRAGLPEGPSRLGDQEADHAALAAPRLRHPPARSRHRRAHDPTAAGPSQPGHHRALSEGRHHARCARPPVPSTCCPSPNRTPPPPHPAGPLLSGAAVAAAPLEVADIFRRFGPAYRQAHAESLCRGQLRVMSAIERCRTAALGGHVEQCDACGHQRITYNTCRNRHCPKCQSLARAQWLEDRQAELLDGRVLPRRLHRPRADRGHRLPEQDGCSTTCCFTPAPRRCAPSPPIPKHLGAEIGFSPSCTPGDRTCCTTPICTAWCPAAASRPTASAGSPAARASSCRCGCCRGCSAGCSCEQLHQAFRAGELHFFGQLRTAARRPTPSPPTSRPAAQAEWVVYAKPPFGGPHQVLDYLGRYTHRVAISNNRLLKLRADSASPSPGRTTNTTPRKRTMTLDAEEFIRRFLLHVLPERAAAHPPLRLPRQPLPPNQARAVSPTAARASATGPAIQRQEDYRDLYLRAHRPITARLPHLWQRAHGLHRDGRGRITRARTFAAGLALMLPDFLLIESRRDRCSAFRPGVAIGAPRRTVNLCSAVGCILCLHGRPLSGVRQRAPPSRLPPAPR